jgi:hypothetical protein
MLFIVILTPILRTVRESNNVLGNPFNFLVRITLLALITWLWAAILIDQLPCFLGVPNCD